MTKPVAMPQGVDTCRRRKSGRMKTPGRVGRLMLDDRGGVVEWSPQAQDLLGYPPEEVLGRPVTAMLDLATQASRGTGGPVAARHRDGHPLDVRVHVWPVVDEDGAMRWSVHLTAPGPAEHEDLDTVLLQTLLTESTLGVQVVDPDLRIVRLNLAGPVPRALGGEQAIGRQAREAVPGLIGETEERLLRWVIDSGQPVTDFEHVGRPPQDPDHDHVYTVSLLPLRGVDGTRLGVLINSTDITEKHRAQGHLKLLVDAGARIGTTLDVTTTADELALASVPALADMAAVDVLDEVFRGEAPPPGPVSAWAPLRRSAFHAARGLDAPTADEPGGTVMAYPQSFTSCLTDRRPRLVAQAEIAKEWAAGEPSRVELMHKTGVHSLIVVPLIARGVVLGMASFYRSHTTEPFEQDELALAAELGARAAVCIDNARQYTREHSTALVLQRSLLPQRVRGQHAVEVAWLHESAEGSGEWFDVIPLSSARVALAVGCMAGHGIDAAVAMGRLRTAINTLSAQDLAPDELFARVHDLVTGQPDDPEGDPSGDPSGKHMAGATCLYAVYDPVSRRCTFARAGHSPPVLVSPDGLVEMPSVPLGPALGEGHPPYETVEMELPVQSMLALCTPNLLQDADGHPDAVPPDLRRILGNPHRTLHDTCDAVGRNHRPSGDDGALLLLARTHCLGDDQVATWTLPSDPAVVATARTLIRQQLVNWSLEELDFSTELLVSELVTNAIRYGVDPITLRVIRERTLVCEVSDGSSTAPYLRYAYATDEGGRGLFLVAQFARRWGTRHMAHGKTIWAEQSLPSRDPSLEEREPAQI
ncbi:SpoIIE family protein phosphatase [Streptomyces sp. NPDC020801]|uniref:SpoIIE family protein phosphatase n=1 Tax=unclassified Streptomyces TaxID=2593676 RepID=UPI0037A856FD